MSEAPETSPPGGEHPARPEPPSRWPIARRALVRGLTLEAVALAAHVLLGAPLAPGVGLVAALASVVEGAGGLGPRASLARRTLRSLGVLVVVFAGAWAAIFESVYARTALATGSLSDAFAAVETFARQVDSGPGSLSGGYNPEWFDVSQVLLFLAGCAASAALLRLATESPRRSYFASGDWGWPASAPFEWLVFSGALGAGTAALVAAVVPWAQDRYGGLKPLLVIVPVDVYGGIVSVTQRAIPLAIATTIGGFFTSWATFLVDAAEEGVVALRQRRELEERWREVDRAHGASP